MEHQDAPVTCVDCHIADPPPEMTCYAGRDHYVGIAHGCPACGRLVLACQRRPCAAMRGGN